MDYEKNDVTDIKEIDEIKEQYPFKKFLPPVHQRILRVCIYARLSKEEEGKLTPEEESESIKNQVRMLTDFAHKMNWIIVDIFTEDGYSGADRNRPHFLTMIQNCEFGKYDIVLCKTQSRFSRDGEIIEKYIHRLFPEWKIRFISNVDHIDTSEKNSAKMSRMQSFMNEMFLLDTSDAVKSTLKNKNENGLNTRSFAAYGYLKDPRDKNKIIVDETIRPIIIDIFTKFANGMGATAIAIYLTEKGIPTRYNYKKLIGSNYKNKFSSEDNIWTPDAVTQILQDEIYIGNYIYNKYYSVSYKTQKVKQNPKELWKRKENTHEAIISRDLWNIVQLRFSKKVNHGAILEDEEKIVVRTNYSTGEVGLFSGNVYCSVCGKRMCQNRTKSKTKDGTEVMNYYMLCKSNKKKPGSCSNTKNIRQDYLEEKVLQYIQHIIQKYYSKEKIEDILSSRMENDRERQKNLKTLEKELNDARTKIEQKNLKLARLLEDRYDDAITFEQFIVIQNQWNTDISLLSHLCTNLEEQIYKIKSLSSELDLENIIEKYKNITTLDRTAIDIFIEKIFVTPEEVTKGKRKLRFKPRL